MFDFHTAWNMPLPVISLTMAMCSIGAHLVVEYSVMNPAQGTQQSEFPDNQQVFASLHARIKVTMLCDLYFKQYITVYLVDHPDTSFDDFEDVIAD